MTEPLAGRSDAPVAAAAVAVATGEVTADVLVVGGGINGAGIARDLAGRGLGVVLCEQGDLAQYTSSSSTKLIHGGLRYLEYYEFNLVRKALAERERLLRSAPHIMWPLRFVMPHDPSMRPVWMIRIGLFLYDHLARREWLPGSGAVNLRRSPLGVPLKPEFVTGFEYSDGWVDDARLVVLNALDAVAHGATVLTRCRCVRAGRSGSGWRATLQPEGGTPIAVQARALVNAAGPWTGEFLRDRLGQPSARSLRLVKGSHIVVPRLFEHDHAYLFQNPDKRVIFAIPYEGRFTLIGTTDVELHGDPGSASVDDDEVDYLCAQASRYFATPVRAADVVWRYTGVRPLLDDESGDPAAVTRDYLLDFDDGPPAAGPIAATGGAPSAGDGQPAGTGRAGPQFQGGRSAPAGQTPAPLLSVWGGKMTTFRKLAEEAADALVQRLGERRPAWTERALLPGGDLSAWIGTAQRPDTDMRRFNDVLARRHPELDPALRARWARGYGGRVGLLLADGAGLGEEVAPGLHAAELDYLYQHEWARSADDVLWRRTKLGLHLAPAERQRVAAWWAARHALVADAVPQETPCN